jgi:eukaryotic-like serine/threonine-protein kinase
MRRSARAARFEGQANAGACGAEIATLGTRPMATNATARTLLVEGVPKEGDILAGKYRLEGTLGAGGMGVVLAARHITLDERFAVKILLPEHAQTPEVVERFLREGRAAIKVRSEHVVRVVDVDTLPNGLPYIVMEYLDGYDLERLVRERGPLSVPLSIDLLLQACEAISEAHALGTVHRDLKPANLFFTQRADGSACMKVLDFGISKVGRRGRENRITTTQSVMGSPEYMAPEQLRSTRDVDARADIWSIGAILFELLSGQPPFHGETVPEVFATVLKDEATPLRDLRPDIPEGLDLVVMRCLQKDPAERYSNCAELASALAPYGTPAAQASAERIARVLHASKILEREDLLAPAPLPRQDPGRSIAVMFVATALATATLATVIVLRSHPTATTPTSSAVLAPPGPTLNSAEVNTTPIPPPTPIPTPSLEPTPTLSPTPTPSPTPTLTPTLSPTPTPTATPTATPTPTPSAAASAAPASPHRAAPAPRAPRRAPRTRAPAIDTSIFPLPLPPPPQSTAPPAEAPTSNDLFEERK